MHDVVAIIVIENAIYILRANGERELICVTLVDPNGQRTTNVAQALLNFYGGPPVRLVVDGA